MIVRKVANFFKPQRLSRKFQGAIPYIRYRLSSHATESLGNGMLKVHTWWGPLIVHERSDSITQSLRKRGVYDLDLSLAVLRAVKRGMTVVNIGANVGIYALLAAKKAGSKGKIHAFEPDPRSFRILQENAKQYPGVIEPLPYAVSDRSGEMELWLDQSEPGDSSFAKKNTDTAEAHRAKVVTLDRFLGERGAHADVIIMDIQGAEPLAFAGMRETLRQERPLTILFECSPLYSENMGISVDSIENILYESGFTIRHIRNSALPDPDRSWSELIRALKQQKEGYGFCNLIAVKK